MNTRNNTQEGKCLDNVRQGLQDNGSIKKSRLQCGIRNVVAYSGLALVLLCGGIQSSHAQGIRVTVNGEPVRFEDIGPQQIDGRTMVPVRGVLEKLGAQISFDDATQTVVASTPKRDIQLKIGSRTAVVNGDNVTLDVPAQVIRDHTFVPLRFLGESLGADVGWDPDTRTVRIITRDALNATPRPRHPRSERDRDRQDRPDRP